MIGRTSNPALNKNTFKNFAYANDQTDVMSFTGAINKTAIMLLLVVLGAMYTWKVFFSSFNPESGISAVMTWIAVGGIGGFVVSLLTIFNKKNAGIFAPIYAVLEGLFLGGISAIFEASYPGIVLRAVALTFSVLFIMLFLYRTKMIKPTEKFKMGVISATGGIVIMYFLSFIFRLFGANMSFLYGNSFFSIGISIFVVVIAALNLVLDFDFIEQGVNYKVPKYMEWYSAFGITVTLVWLYIEILNLLLKLSSRSR
ncbi:MAG: Bax inhibitor-1/YccA family protein [Bacteroidetes bacterium]|nr:Bax inhibitor-1/YccA family protein [Bacteroidota bacterium]